MLSRSLPREVLIGLRGVFRKWPMSVRLFVHSALLSVLGFLLVRTASGIARIVHEERCLLRVPNFLQNAFVPPFNCSLCEQLEEVPWIWANQTDEYRHW